MSDVLYRLPDASAAALEPLVPEPEPASVRPLAAPPTRTYWERLTGKPLHESNAAALRADLAGPTGATPRRKRIVICADGTWNTPVKEGQADASTNVWRLYQLVKDHAADGTPQLKYYHAGVGTTGPLARRILDGAVGRGVSAAMQDCYRFLVGHYRPGDAVYLFGFSRGAYTARTLAGMLGNSGILNFGAPASRVRAHQPGGRERLLGEAFALYRDREPSTRPVAPRAVAFRAMYAHPDFRIACVGVWDTVGALGVPVEGGLRSPVRWFNERVAGFHDVTLSASVDCAFHALAIDEQRSAFEPTLWLQQPQARAAGQVLEQVWFPGVHSDVGGGYDGAERGLANVTLRWMVNRVSDTCGLEFDVGPLVGGEAPGCAFTVHDSMGAVYRVANRVGLMRATARTLDAGLCPGGVRDPGRLATESAHPCVAHFFPVDATSDAASREPACPGNVLDYRARSAQPAAAWSVAATGGWADRRRTPPPADVDAITLERRAADGSVTSTLALTRDGAVRYTAAGAVCRGTLDPDTWTRLTTEVVGDTFFNLADEYTVPGAARVREATVLTVASGRRRKRVVSYDRFGPAWLEDVERAVDGVRAAARWEEPAGSCAAVTGS